MAAVNAEQTEEAIAGDLLCTQLMEIVKETVKTEIPRKIVEEVLVDFQMSKYYLMLKIMDDLAEKENFSEYKSYINNSHEFALRWITQYTNEKIFLRQNVSGSTRYAEIAKIQISRIIRCVVKSIYHATNTLEGQRGVGMSQWIAMFCQIVSEEIVIPVSSLFRVSARSVVDFNNLQRIIVDQLPKFQKVLERFFTDQTHNTVHWDGVPPSQQILDKIWGCPEQCPFCNEPCIDRTRDHYALFGRSHMCVQHRPIGIRGIRYVDTRKLWHESCNYLIQLEGRTIYCSGWKFKCRDNGRCSCTGTTTETSSAHKCTEYRTYLPDWDIAPDPTNNVSKYWMWFMATFEVQLKDMHKAEILEIPLSWKSVTKSDALNDLMKIHH